MEGLSSVNILAALAVLVFVAIGLDVLRRVRRSRYENIQMSSSRLSKTSKCRDDLDDIFGSDFPAGGSRIVGMRNIDFDAMEDVLLSPQDIGERYTSGEPKGQVNMALEDSSSEPDACMRSEAEASAKKKPPVMEEPQIMIIHLMSEKGIACESLLRFFNAPFQESDQQCHHSIISYCLLLWSPTKYLWQVMFWMS